jgi:hypothetical protein
MSHSKIIDLRERCGKQASSNDFDNDNDLATQQECIRLLRAFTQIANPRIRAAIIQAAQEAASNAKWGRCQRPIASRILRRWPTMPTLKSFRSSAVEFGRTVSSISFCVELCHTKYHCQPRSGRQTKMRADMVAQFRTPFGAIVGRQIEDQ